MAGEKTKVFVSYSREDRLQVSKLAGRLGAEDDIEVFRDTEDILPTEEWKQRLEQLIIEADTVVFALSPASASSRVCHWEIEVAGRYNKRIAPVVIAAVAPDRIPPELSRYNYIFLTPEDDFEKGIVHLIQALNTDIGWIREHTRLGDLANRWRNAERLGAQKLRGSELTRAEQWLALQPKNAPAPTELHRSYIYESRRAATRRSRIIAGVSLASALVVGILGVFAWTQRNAAEISSARLALGTGNDLMVEGDVNAAALVLLKSAEQFDRDDAPGRLPILLKDAAHLLDGVTTSKFPDATNYVATRNALYILQDGGRSILSLDNSGARKDILKGTTEDSPVVALNSLSDGKLVMLVRQDGVVEQVDARTGTRTDLARIPDADLETNDLPTPFEYRSSEEQDLKVHEDGTVVFQAPDKKAVWIFLPDSGSVIAEELCCGYEFVRDGEGRRFLFPKSYFAETQSDAPEGDSAAGNAGTGEAGAGAAKAGSPLSYEIVTGPDDTAGLKPAPLTRDEVFDLTMRACFSRGIYHDPVPETTEKLKSYIGEGYQYPQFTSYAFACGGNGPRFVAVHYGDTSEGPEQNAVMLDAGSDDEATEVRDLIQDRFDEPLTYEGFIWLDVNRYATDEIIGAIQDRDLYVFSDGIQYHRRLRSTPNLASFVSSDRVAVVMPQENTVEVYSFGDSQKDYRYAEAGEKFTLRNNHGCRGNNNLIAEAFEGGAIIDIDPAALPDRVAETLGSQLGADIAGRFQCVALSRDGKYLLAETGWMGPAYLLDAEKLKATGKVEDASLADLGKQTTSAFFLDNDDVVSSDMTSQVKIWKEDTGDHSWKSSVLYNSDNQIFLAEPDGDGKALIVVEALGGHSFKSYLYSIAGKEKWFDFGGIFRWYGVAFTSDNMVLLSNSDEINQGKLRVYEIPDLEDLVKTVRSSLPPECLPVGLGSFENSPCWPKL